MTMVYNVHVYPLCCAELDKYKQEATALQADIEQKERDDVKNTIMLGLLNSQLDAAKEEARRNADTIFDLKKKVPASRHCCVGWGIAM